MNPYDRYCVDAHGNYYVGKHLILDFFGIDQSFTNDALVKMFEDCCNDINATIMQTQVQDFGEGCGTTGIIILAESHLSWHHYSEANSIFIDIFTCGTIDPTGALPRMKKFFKQSKVDEVFLTRGRVHHQK